MALESDPLDWPWKPNHSPSREDLQKWRVTVVLQAFRNLARYFPLPPTRITLRDILRDSVARKAFDDLLNRSQTVSGVDFRRVLEKALLTIPLLPGRYPRTLRSRRRQALDFPTRVRNWADELEQVLKVVGSQAGLDKGKSSGASSKHFAQLPRNMRQCARFLDERLSHTRMVSYGSRNPQLRTAILLSTFIKVATGRFGDTRFAVLLESAFLAFGEEPPSWIERLNLERKRQAMSLKRLWEKTFRPRVFLR